MRTKMSGKYILSDDNIEIHYWTDYKNNNSNKKKFIFLHPASSMNHTALEPLEKLLDKEGFSTINIDPRGTGYSQAPNDKEYFSLEKYTKDISEILKREGIENPNFIGHSMGFMPIVNYVADTDNGDKIFGIGGSYHFPDTTASKPLFHLYNKVLRYNELVGSAITGIGYFIKDYPRPYNDQSLINKGKNDYRAFVDVSLKEALNHCISGIEINKWNITEQLKKINNEIILIYGKKDLAVVPEKAGLKIIEMTKNAHMHELDGGHDIPIKKPELIVELVKTYNNMK